MRTVSLSGIVLLADYRVEDRLQVAAVDHAVLPTTVDDVLAELNSRPVHATIEVPKARGRDACLIVYCGLWRMQLYPTRPYNGVSRGYTIGAFAPLRLRDHHRLASGCLALHTSFSRVYDIRDLSDTVSAHWERLAGEHDMLIRQQAATQQPVAEKRPAEHDTFLDRIEEMINADEQLTLAARSDPFPIAAIKPVGEQRKGVYPMYKFVLAGNETPAEDAFVSVRGEAEMRGRVVAVRGRSVTVQFDDPVDWNRLPAAGGELEVTVSSVVYRKQREAVALLRDGLSRNPTLLSTLVDYRPAPIRPTTATPMVKLDIPQRQAFEAALGCTDLVIINGPPGTGKTRVISQIANTTARETGRVLITAHSNRAVDNVLIVLPKELTVIRVGGGKVTEDGQRYLLENRAWELRDRVLGTVHTTVGRYGDLDLAANWAEVLASQTVELGMALDQRAARHVDWSRERRAAGGAAGQAVDRLAKVARKLASKLDRITKSLCRNENYANRFAFLASWFAARRRRLEARAAAVRAVLAANAHDTAAAELRLDESTKDIPAVAAVRHQLDQARMLVGNVRSKALSSAVAAAAAVGADEQAPVVHGTTSATAEVHAELTMLSQWVSARVPLLRRRAALLREWHTAVSDADTQLYPELIRYADVVAATSIGSASRPELSDVDLELAIVDEAGQIGMADVLVPLVRARRAVLVGDRMQLPPFLDAEVEKWGGTTGDDAIPYLLTHSVLEMLEDKLPTTHVKWLTEQRRMPAVIGNFISTAFYENRLTTRVDRRRVDDVFDSPFAFVDTSTLSTRRERPASAVERGGTGYLNQAEAELLARLAAHYDQRGEEWAVILPYQAQVKQVRKRLRTLVGDKEIIDLNVATVDSFQGGERTVVLYGFTRSNKANKVGFLDELRRANVAFTRAKEQLVLIGDLEMLTNATDRSFRDLLRSLRAYVGSNGEISAYPDVMDRINRLDRLETHA